MIKEYLKIETLYVEDDEVKFKISGSNGIASSSIEVYGYIDSFKDFGVRLEKFPFSEKEEEIFKIGDKSEDWAYFLLIKVFLYEPSGATALEVRMNNKEKIPRGSDTLYYLTSIPANINRFGKSLANWNPKDKKEFTWFFE